MGFCDGKRPEGLRGGGGWSATWPDLPIGRAAPRSYRLRMTAHDPVLRVRGLRRTYDADSAPVRALRGVDLLPMKVDIRKLKSLGLTISHDVGYELSPRGTAYLAWLERGKG